VLSKEPVENLHGFHQQVIDFEDDIFDINRSGKLPDLDETIKNKQINLNCFGVTVYDADGYCIGGNHANLDFFKELQLQPEQSVFDDPIFKTRGYSEELIKLKMGETVELPESVYFVRENSSYIVGNSLFVRNLAFPVLNEYGSLKKIVVVHEDITERIKVEEDQKKLNSYNQLLLTSAGEGIIGLNLYGNITFANPIGAEMLGWKPDEIYYCRWCFSKRVCG